MKILLKLEWVPHLKYTKKPLWEGSPDIFRSSIIHGCFLKTHHIFVGKIPIDNPHRNTIYDITKTHRVLVG